MKTIINLCNKYKYILEYDIIILPLYIFYNK